MLKRVLKILLLFIVLVVISAVLLINSVNTERNKRGIQQAILSSTGYELEIAGDMEVNLFPSLGLTLNDVRLKNPDSPQELASTSAAVLRIDILALLGGELLIEELSTDDPHVNYYVDAQGRSIWDVARPDNDDDLQGIVIGNAEESIALANQQAGNDSGGDTLTVSFQRLRISNASVDFQDLSRGIRYSINNLDLESDGTNLEGRPFELDVRFDFLNNGMSKPTSMGLRGNIVADVNSGNFSMKDINFNITPMLLQGQIELSNINDTMVFGGSLESNSFDVVGLLQTLGAAETEQEFRVPNANTEGRKLAFNFSFSGDETQLIIPTLAATLGASELEADANVRFATEFTPNNISYNIISSGIDLTPFMSQDDDATTTGTENTSDSSANGIANTTPPSPGQSDTELPNELLRSVNVLGSISIESLIANDILFSNINIFTNIEDGVLDIEIQPISVYGGTIQGNVHLDANNEDSNFSTQLSLSELNIVDLAPSISRLNAVTGKLDLKVDYEASGSTSNELLESITGSTTFTITENSVDIGLLKQVFTAISALSPSGGTIEQWPDVIQFSELGGSILLDGGIKENQKVQLRMDNFDISGTGGIDLAEQTFDYDMLFTILGEPFPQTIQVDELYHNVSWPVRCSAAFDDSVVQYCRPDFSQVRQIFTQIGTNALRNRINDTLTDQLPDAARSLLRDLLN